MTGKPPKNYIVAEKLHNRCKSYFWSFVRKLKAAIELRRSKNLGLRVFVAVGVTVYFAGKIVGDLKDQNGTLSKLEGPK